LQKEKEYWNVKSNPNLPTNPTFVGKEMKTDEMSAIDD